MSDMQGKRFKVWLESSGKTLNTANAYLSGVNTVSKHLGRDVLSITDLHDLGDLYRQYGPGGEHAQIGSSNSNNVQSGLKQWLEYQKQAQQAKGSSIDPVAGRKQWDAFLVRWPVSALRKLTLEQYYGTAGDESFYSWVSDHTNQLGDFKEGVLSAGVRLRTGKAKAATDSNMQSDGRYLWYTILGNSAQEAFEHLKAELLTAVDAVQKGDLSLMVGLKDAPGALVWRVAFLYQNQAQPLVLPFYTQKQLKRVAGPKATGSILKLQQQLLAQRGDRDILEYAAELELKGMLMPSAIVKEERGNLPVSQISVDLNQILFGPPGTGKTYETIDAALAILDPEILVLERAERKAHFDAFVRDGRVRFVTFHQSFSYEDFVEGLRASGENGQLNYRVEAGVFKRICEDAVAVAGVPTADELLAQFVEQVAETPVTLETARGKRFVVSHKYGNSTLTCMPEASESGRELPANIEHVRQLMHGVRANNIYCESYVKGIVDFLVKKHPEIAKKPTESSLNLVPHVLIIDEINRGNVSRIFGELITLIERSKRAGAAEALEVTLPYSKQTFSVPGNLYILGTMNTADRSLAGLDIALRRRFTFVEMPPKPELLDEVEVEGINIGALLRVMNQRIEVLLDRDHCLGHAYFMRLIDEPSLALLESIFRNQILPLLQEYFFEDWERIGWVLNDQRAQDTAPFVQRPQTEQNLAVLFGNDIAGQLNDQRWQLNDSAFSSPDSYRNILG